jgi:fructose-specific phosphotransferase system IIC component
MVFIFVSVALPLLLVFGLYHLLTWFNTFRINERIYWKRVALASALAHVILATGFFVFSYYDYEANRQLGAQGLSYGSYLFVRSDFWRLIAIFDTLAVACILGLFTAVDRLGIPLPGLVAVTILITYAVGTVQWYFVGGAVGALLERFWTGLKTEDDEDEVVS